MENSKLIFFNKYLDLQRIEYPYCWLNHVPFVKYLVDKIDPNIIVELGTHSGNSLVTMLESSSSKCEVYAVDTWEGDDHSKKYSIDIFNNLNNFIQNNYSERCKLLKMKFELAADNFSNNSIDLLHIDGYHTYEAVRNDYLNYISKVRKGGIILFHDVLVKDNDFGVYKLWKELTKEYPGFIQRNGTGLGVLLNDFNPNSDFEKIKSDHDTIFLLSLLGDNLRLKYELTYSESKLKYFTKSRYFSMADKFRRFLKK